MHSLRQLCILTGLFFFSLILFTWGISSQEVIGFESRFYLFAQEMWRNGASWFPTTYNQPYPDYPGLSTFLIYVTALLAGGISKLVAVLPSAIAAGFTVVATYAIGALRSKRWGICAVFLLLMTVTFFKSARSITLDIYPALVTTICFYLVYSADELKKPQRQWWVYPLLVLSFAFRGPIGLVMPTGVVCIYYLLQRRLRECVLTGLLALCLLFICGSVLVWLAYHTGGYAFMQDVLRMEVIGRLGDSHLPFYYYLRAALTDYALAFPLALIVVLGVVFQQIKSKTELHFILQLFAWLLVILLGMSIPGDKKIRYILPLAPAAALIAAYPFVSASRQTYFIWLRNLMLCIFFLLPFLLWLACLLTSHYLKNKSIPLTIPLIVFVLLAVLQIINLGFVIGRSFLKTYRSILIPGIAACAFALVFITVVEPLTLYIERARDFVLSVESKRQQAGANLVFYKEGQDGLPIKYLINTQQASAQFIENEQDLFTIKSPVFFITRESQFTSLPATIKNQFRLLETGSMGHVTMVVFTRK